LQQQTDQRKLQTLFSAFVADKIKSTLPEACLDHVLTSEGKTWLECDALADTCDIYFVNHTVEGRPKSVRSEFRARNNNASENVHKDGTVNAGELNEILIVLMHRLTGLLVIRKGRKLVVHRNQ
jgi:hypothetical protein